MNRRTVQRPVEWRGVGVHSGEACGVRVLPGGFGDGLALAAADGSRCPVDVDHVVERAGATVLDARRPTSTSTSTSTVSTVEHLLAALVAHGITDAVIEADAAELPILDGSAAPYWEALREVGFVEAGSVDPLVISEVIEVRAHGGAARWSPRPPGDTGAGGCRVGVRVDFGLFAGQAACDVPGDGFADVMAARTFALGREVDALLAAGRGRGGTLENTVVWDDTGPRNALRMPDEPVRHKLIDVIGDLALVGRPVVGCLFVDRPSHALHHAAIRALRSGGATAPTGR